MQRINRAHHLLFSYAIADRGHAAGANAVMVAGKEGVVHKAPHPQEKWSLGTEEHQAERGPWKNINRGLRPPQFLSSSSELSLYNLHP